MVYPHETTHPPIMSPKNDFVSGLLEHNVLCGAKYMAIRNDSILI